MVKKVNMVLFSTVTELLVFLNCCKHPRVKHRSQPHYATLNPLEQEDIKNCNSQLVLLTTEWQCELQPAAAFLKICLEQRSVQTEINFMKLRNKFIQ
jgi:hypothetical protein